MFYTITAFHFLLPSKFFYANNYFENRQCPVHLTFDLALQVVMESIPFIGILLFCEGCPKGPSGWGGEQEHIVWTIKSRYRSTNCKNLFCSRCTLPFNWLFPQNSTGDFEKQMHSAQTRVFCQSTSCTNGRNQLSIQCWLKRCPPNSYKVAMTARLNKCHNNN